MNKRVKAAIAASLMIAFTAPQLASMPTAYAAQQTDENNTEFARSIINSATGSADRFLSSKYSDQESVLLKYTEQITAGAKDKYEAALMLYDWMVYNVTYKWGTFGPESINYIFEKKQGTCTDFSYAYMAWLRYNGIKAWCATGSYYSGSYRWDHTWCVAEINGVEYIFDPEVQNYNYVRTGNMSHSKFCRATADATENYVASSARYFNYDSGDTSQTVESYRMQTGNGGQIDYDLEGTSVSSAPAYEAPAASVANENADPDAPELPTGVDGFAVEVPADTVTRQFTTYDILTDADFGINNDTNDAVTAVEILSYDPGYDDVNALYEYYNGIRYVSLAGIMNGTDSETFAPDSDITRGMLVTVLGRMAGADTDVYDTSFTDIDGDEWYAPYVEWAVDKGIVLGYDDGTFRPDAEVTREQFYVIMKRLIEADGVIPGEGYAYFADMDYISSWAVEAVAVCDGVGLIPKRMDGLLMPLKMLSRGELADAILRYALYIGDVTE